MCDPVGRWPSVEDFFPQFFVNCFWFVYLFVLFCFAFQDKISQSIPGCPGICFVDQASVIFNVLRAPNITQNTKKDAALAEPGGCRTGCPALL